MLPPSVHPPASDWARDPRGAFDSWLAARRFRGSSADVYRAQWNHFLDWLGTHGKTLMTTEPAVIDEFVATLEVKRQQRARYLRIMERVFDDIATDRPSAGNPARPIARSIDAPWADTRSNAPTGFLPEAERQTFWRELDRVATPAGVPLSWRDLRDRAMASTMLGLGLKLAEVETLPLRHISRNTREITVEAADALYTRRIPLPPRVATILAHWRAARAHAEVAGELAFPAGRSGRPMHKATVLRAIDTLVEVAGLRTAQLARVSPQTLRNAYAAALFEAGHSDDQVAERLGFAQPVSAKRLRHAWIAWQQASDHAARVQAAVIHAQSDSPGPA